MFLRRISLQHFRNIPLAALDLAGPRQFLVGANGQGKTALLEAAGFLTALRSFRTAETRLLIAHGQPEATLVCTVEHEQRGATDITIKLKSGAKEVWMDQERVTRLGDFLGQFPTVAFSSQDQQLIRGSPGGRRRWLDLTLAAMDGAYLQALQGYHRALEGRNALLKKGAPADQLSAFERPLAAQGALLMAARATGLASLATDLTAAYVLLADQAEPAGFAYAPDLTERDEAALLARLASGRARDAQMRTTLAGPHRDDFDFTLNGRPAKDFASEGQQRSLVLSLRLAQAAYYQCRSGIKPVLLADDVLGELDPGRRRRFWTAIASDTQVIATGTALPPASEEDRPWQVFEVKAGAFAPLEASA
jgi:DNA replication and repair protein RecF